MLTLLRGGRMSKYVSSKGQHMASVSVNQIFLHIDTMRIGFWPLGGKYTFKRGQR